MSVIEFVSMLTVNPVTLLDLDILDGLIIVKGINWRKENQFPGKWFPPNEATLHVSDLTIMLSPF